jgi:predicted flap endonuclease-1-like 5' DNA nuclease
VNYKVEEVEGIGPQYGAKLNAAGIDDTAKLLEQCGSRKGREAVAEQTGLSTQQLLQWANQADLMRLSGIGKQYSELLEAAGVDTVKELACRNAANLAKAMADTNAEKQLAKSSPSEGEVAKWIEQAKTTEPCISH